MGAFFDRRGIQWTFGLGLPAVAAFAMLSTGSKFLPDFEGRETALLFMYGDMALELLCAFTFGVWLLSTNSGRRLPRFGAVALSVGAALWAWYAASLVGGPVFVFATSSHDSWEIQIVALLLAIFSLAALLTSIVYFRAASRTWASSASRAALHPRRTVLMIGLGYFAANLLLGWIVP